MPYNPPRDYRPPTHFRANSGRVFACAVTKINQRTLWIEFEDGKEVRKVKVSKKSKKLQWKGD